MTRGMTRGLCGLGVAALVGCGWWLAAAQAEEKPADPAVARARKQVQMLDDLYKSTIVMITEHYVDEKSDLAAGSAFQKIFKTMKDKGYHEVRLLDATGEPFEAKNVAKDDFEKDAIKALKSGKPYYEQVVELGGKRYLRAATPIPVVMKKCTLCHPNYEQVKAGEPIGALGYKLLVE
jgi:Protein of unknown function (DUF3365)